MSISLKCLCVKISVLLGLGAVVVLAGSTAESAPLNLVDAPLFLNQAVAPLNLLVVGRDHKLYYEAYNDHADLNSDGVLDIQYKPDQIDYFGYFDSYKCYTHDGSKFVPSNTTTNKQCSSKWSGDWLNYVTTTRMDALRKVLYGGRRSTDSSSATVLERSHIPQDAHSWVKEYTSVTNDGYDISKYTPLSVPTGGNLHLFANVTLMLQTSWTSNGPSSSTNPPLLRVAQNKPYRAWNWASVESPDSGACASANDGQCSGYGGSGVLLNPTDYIVRVEVCKTGLLEANCQKYPSGNYKPVGLLQQYGENDSMLFGLLSGSYEKSKSGGVLRKNIGSIKDEINTTTDGTFTSTNGIIKTIDTLRTIGYSNYRSDAWYQGAGRGAGTVYSPGLVTTRPFNEPEFGGMWGNPIAEMMYEGLRYFSGQTSPTTAFDYGTSGTTLDAQLGLPRATWTNPYSTALWCAKPFELVMSDVNVSYDTDQLPGVDTNFGSGITNTLPGSLNVSSEASTIWNTEFGTSSTYFIGQSGANYDGAPTAKTVTSFASIRGLAPEEPTKQGGYYAASVAYYGRTHDINSSKANDQKVQTFVVGLASPLPRIDILVNGKTITLIPFGKSVGGVSISAAKGSFQPTNQIVDFYMLQQPTTTGGSFQVNFEDVEAGNDHDMDAIVKYTWYVSGGSVTITTESKYAAGGIIQHMGYVISGTTQDGIYLEVRDYDTAAASDIPYFLDTPYPKTPGQCDSPSACYSGGVCNSTTGCLYLSSTRTFTPGATPGADLLKDPLWYAAKWGGFREAKEGGNNKPDLQTEWDADKDGIPDNYFLVTNALSLGTELATAFNEIIARTTSASSASVNSGSISTDTRVYQARFNSGDWTGQLLSYQVKEDGSLNTDLNDPANWDAGQLIPAPNLRQIITTNTDGTPVPFRWANLDSTRKAQLDSNTTTAQNKLDYLRGDASKELGKTNGVFRKRTASKLGDIVNSTPVFVGRPPFPYLDTLESKPYSAFRTAQSSRTSVVYAGANDGMLHAFRADNGTELFGFIPAPIFPKLTGGGTPSWDLTSPGYTHKFFVDGVSTMGDVFFSNAWHTVLIGALNNGGHGIYALDITDPTKFTEAQAASVVLWQFTDTNDADLGFTFGQPSIVRLQNDTWAAVFGNGYNSTAGYAALFILDIATGSVIKKIRTQAGTTFPNGLSTPAVVDFDDDVNADYVFAGDMLGNLWKFDIRDKNPANWKVAYSDGSGNPLPLYVAKDGASPANLQPITNRPEVDLGPGGGDEMIVLFGTGKYLELIDKDLPPLQPQRNQSFYGVVDKNTHTSSDIVSGRSALQQQTIDKELTVTLGGQTSAVRLTSKNPVGSLRGWYIDLVSPVQGYQGEKQVSRPILRNGRVIFTTLIPDKDPCAPGGTSWLMELDGLTGGTLEESPFDLNADDKFSTDDQVEVTLADGSKTKIYASGLGSTVGITPEPGILVDTVRTLEYKYTPGTSGDISVTTNNPGSGSYGRQSWRQLQ